MASILSELGRSIRSYRALSNADRSKLDRRSAQLFEDFGHRLVDKFGGTARRAVLGIANPIPDPRPKSLFDLVTKQIPGLLLTMLGLTLRLSAASYRAKASLRERYGRDQAHQAEDMEDLDRSSYGSALREMEEASESFRSSKEQRTNYKSRRFRLSLWGTAALILLLVAMSSV